MERAGDPQHRLLRRQRAQDELRCAPSPAQRNRRQHPPAQGQPGPGRQQDRQLPLGDAVRSRAVQLHQHLRLHPDQGRAPRQSACRRRAGRVPAERDDRRLHLRSGPARQRRRLPGLRHRARTAVRRAPGLGQPQAPRLDLPRTGATLDRQAVWQHDPARTRSRGGDGSLDNRFPQVDQSHRGQ